MNKRHRTPRGAMIYFRRLKRQHAEGAAYSRNNIARLAGLTVTRLKAIELCKEEPTNKEYALVVGLIGRFTQSCAPKIKQVPLPPEDYLPAKKAQKAYSISPVCMTDMINDGRVRAILCTADTQVYVCSPDCGMHSPNKGRGTADKDRAALWPPVRKGQIWRLYNGQHVRIAEKSGMVCECKLCNKSGLVTYSMIGNGPITTETLRINTRFFQQHLAKVSIQNNQLVWQHGNSATYDHHVWYAVFAGEAE